jgi:hypothetical protein
VAVPKDAEFLAHSERQVIYNVLIFVEDTDELEYSSVDRRAEKPHELLDCSRLSVVRTMKSANFE